MRQYELTYLLSDQVSESDLKKVTGKIGGIISDLGGEVIKEESWGRRKLAYPIDKENFASYFTLYFELDSEHTKKFERELKEVSGLIRHLLIVSDFGKKELTLEADEVVDTEEIEQVAGGEKTFEAVEGKTERSKELMKVRGDDSDEDKGTKEEQKEEKTPENKVSEAEEKKKSEKVAEAKKKTDADKDTKEAPQEKKKEKKQSKGDEKDEDDADRLAKLDEELEDILKEEE